MCDKIDVLTYAHKIVKRNIESRCTKSQKITSGEMDEKSVFRTKESTLLPTLNSVN